MLPLGSFLVGLGPTNPLSYLFIFPEGVKAIPAQELTVGDTNKTKLSWWLDSVTIGQPTKNDGSSSKQLLPRECRERGMVYGAPMTGVFKYAINDGDQHRLER